MRPVLYNQFSVQYYNPVLTLRLKQTLADLRMKLTYLQMRISVLALSECHLLL